MSLGLALKFSAAPLLKGVGVGPLDAYTSSLGLAMGVRRLVGRYRGPLVRLRRGSDNVESDFYPKSNGWLDMAAISTWLGGATGYVTTLYDQWSRAAHAVQATTSAQPTIDVSGVRPEVVFGTSKFLTSPYFETVTQSALLTIANPTAPHDGTRRFIIESYSDYYWASLAVESNSHLASYAFDTAQRTAESAVAVKVGNNQLFSRTWTNGGALAAYANATSIATVAVGTVTMAGPYTGLRIGTYRTADARWWKGRISEIVISKAASDHAGIAALMMRGWGVTGAADVAFTAANGGQGLASDGTYHYFAKDNGAVDATIYKYDYAGGAITSFAGPEHSQGITIRADYGTLLASAFRVGAHTPKVWEITKTGTKVREWDFTGVDGAWIFAIAYKSPGVIYLLTSTAPDGTAAITIREVTLADNGTYTLGSAWTHATFGLVQGLIVVNGALWLLVDDLPTSNMGSMYRLGLNGDGTITPLDSIVGLAGSEREGVSYDGTTWFYGTGANQIIRLDVANASLGVTP